MANSKLSIHACKEKSEWSNEGLTTHMNEACKCKFSLTVSQPSPKDHSSYSCILSDTQCQFGNREEAQFSFVPRPFYTPCNKSNGSHFQVNGAGQIRSQKCVQP